MKSNLKNRLVTGVALIAGISLLLYAGRWGLTLLVLLVNGFGQREYFRLNVVPHLPPRITTIITILSSAALINIAVTEEYFSLPMLFLAWLPFPIVLFQRIKRPFVSLAVCYLSLVWLTVPLSGLLLLPTMLEPKTVRPELALAYFILLWANDSFAYLVGSRFGKTPLFRRISPGKTWQGSFGGLAGCLLLARINAIFFPALSPLQWLIAGVIVATTGTLGDLFKSVLKRQAGVKDSGTLLPGHGGVLDRFDSLLGSVLFFDAFLYALRLR